MKKLIAVLLVALLAIVLVACGGDDTTTPTTTPGGTTPTTTPGGTTPAETTPAETTPTGTTPAETDPVETSEGIDILNNLDDPDYNVINGNYDGNLNAFTFEDTHASLDFHVALVIQMGESVAYGVYEDLFTTLSEDNNDTWEANPNYRWVVTVDGKDIEITRFSLFNNRTSGWIRIDLGEDFSFDNYTYDENNQHEFDISIKIYGTDGKVVYYAYLTDPNFNGPYVHTKPPKVEMIADADRPSNLVAISSADMTPLRGPQPASQEDFENLFDGDVRSKLCYTGDGEDNAIEVMFKSQQTISGFSLVNANDNRASYGRTVLSFSLYCSDTGADDSWTEVVTYDGTNEDGTPIDKNTDEISANYLERYYALEEPITATYIKLVVNNGEMYQIAELLFWVEN